MTAPLYNLDILRLAAAVADFPSLAAPMARVERRAPVCGSRATIDVNVDDRGRITEIGMAVHACALGQAAATLLAKAGAGRTPEDLARARDALAAWLVNDRAAVPDWPRIEVLSAARAYPARHASIRLPFEAAAEAATMAMATARANVA